MSNGHGLEVKSMKNGNSQCHAELAARGVPEELCEFYNAVVECEKDMTHATYRLSRELANEAANDIPDMQLIVNNIQTFSKKFNVWNQALDELVLRQLSLPALKLNLSQLKRLHSMPAKCSLQNKQVQTENGQEAYVSTLSCFLPSPDNTAAQAINRLQIHLLTYWFDCDKKIESTLRTVVTNLLPTVQKLQNFDFQKNGNTHRDRKQWQHHVTQLADLIGEFPEDSWTKLHTVLGELESELDSQQSTDLNSLTEVISNLDRAVESYKDFHDNRFRFQTKLERSNRCPIVCESTIKKDNVRSGRHRRYYEIKLTALDTVVTEETIHIGCSNEHKQTRNLRTGYATLHSDVTNGHSTDDVTSTPQCDTSNGKMVVQEGGKYESAETEEMTSISHEENAKYIIRSVVDPRNGSEIDIKQAVQDGIVDHQSGQFINPSTGQTWPIAVAMNDGRIRVERVVKSRSADQKTSIGVITIRVQTDTREYVITGAVDMITNVLLSADEARQRGIINEAEGYFLDTTTQERVPLSDAVDAGQVKADFDLETTSDTESGSSQCETKSYGVSGVVDQIARETVSFSEAVRRGLIDTATGCYVNNKTGERVLASEAIKRNFFKCSVLDETSTLADIDKKNRVTVDRIQRIRKNVLRNVKILAAFKQSTN